MTTPDPGLGDRLRHSPPDSGGPLGPGAVEALTFDLQWNAACRFGLTQTSFNSSLSRIVESPWPQAAVSTRSCRTCSRSSLNPGVLTDYRLQAVDTTVLDYGVGRKETVA